MSPDREDRRTDAQLLRAARFDGDAFLVIFERHGSRIERWFARQVRSREAALDLTAETFARALEGVGRFRPVAGESALPWLFGIGANLLRIYWRDERVERAARERVRTHEALTFSEGPESVYNDAFDSRLTTSALREALGGLPQRHRRAIVLRVIQELPYEDVAGELGCTPDNARLRVSRAIRALRIRTLRSSQHADL